MKIVIFLCVFLLEIFSTSYVHAYWPYNGVKYHYADCSTQNRTSEFGWHYCEHTYDDADRGKEILLILPNDDNVPRKIGFYCKEDEKCNELRCLVNDYTVFYFILFILVLMLIVIICGPHLERLEKERASVTSNCQDGVSNNAIRRDTTVA